MKNKISNILILFVVLMLAAMCFDANTGNVASEKDRNEQVDYAKYLLYKANLYLNCNCKAIKVSGNSENKRDTLSVLSLDIALDTTMVFNDTVVYYFNYLKRDIHNENLFVLSSPYNGCSHYNGVAFSTNSDSTFNPIYLLIQEKSFVPLTPEKLNEITIGFKKCAVDTDVNVNPWLKSYLKNQALPRNK